MLICTIRVPRSIWLNLSSVFFGVAIALNYGRMEEVLGLAVISVVVGLVLAGVYHYLSMRLQRWVSRRPVTMLPLITIASFFIRIIVLVGILAALGLWSGLNILAVCIAFIVAFTIMNGIWLYILTKKRQGQPPSAGVTGA